MTVTEAREMLAEVTPLKDDCGRLCGGACCRSMEGEETGMLLFPGEESLYDGAEGFRIIEGAAGKLIICSGRCDRAQRPLSCRLFPLMPVIRNGAGRVEMDERARAVCPLVRYGKAGLSDAFLQAVRRISDEFAEDVEQAPFVMHLTRMQDELRALRQQFTGR